MVEGNRCSIADGARRRLSTRQLFRNGTLSAVFKPIQAMFGTY